MKSIVFFFAVLFTSNIEAQIEEIFSARDDAQTYLNHYLSPVMNGLMYNVNNGWYSTGKTHEKWGFDFSFIASAAIIPEDEKLFIFDAAEYNNLNIVSGSNYLPTAAGSKTTTNLVTSNEFGSNTFEAIDGIGDEWPEKFVIPVSVPTPMIQAGLGIPGGTDIKLRYFPKVNSNEVSFGMIGLGIMHDLTQHLLFLDKIPTLHISGLGAFTHSTLVYTPTNSGVAGSNQSMEIAVNTYTVQAIGDIDLKIVNFYLGLGYTAGSTNLDALGTYQYDFDNNGSYSSNETITDPMSLKFNINGFKTTAGVRLNLGPVRIFADYTLQKYNTITTGIAMSIR